MVWNKGKTKETDFRISQYSKSGKEHNRWRGGKSKDASGYIKLNINLIDEPYKCMCDSSGWVFEHRYIMAVHIKRPLTKNDIVHHLDGDISNNDIDNLKLLTRSEHSKHHCETGDFFPIAKRKGKVISDNELLDDLAQVIARYGLVKYKEYDKYGKYCSETIRRRFGIKKKEWNDFVYKISNSLK